MSAVEELYSLLLPLNDERLIVPRACVAEVVRYSELKSEPGNPDYLLGELGWNGRDIPVVSFEGAMQQEVPAVTGRTRIVIFVAAGSALNGGYFGVVTQGFPQLVRVNRDVLKFESDEGWADGSPVYCRVKMINEFPLIPDLVSLESMLADEQG